MTFSLTDMFILNTACGIKEVLRQDRVWKYFLDLELLHLVMVKMSFGKVNGPFLTSIER